MNDFLEVFRPVGELTASTSNKNYKMELGRRFAGTTALIEMSSDWYPTGVKRKPYQVESRTALIRVEGALSMDPWYWDETGYGEIQSDVQFALSDEDVDQMLLVINSPGGCCDGAYETADAIQAANKIKPVYAVAAPFAYSAAYMLASQARKIWAPEISGGVGSIGVYCIHFDYSKMLEKAGIVATIIQAGEGKTDGNSWEPLSKDAQARIQADIDRLYGAFVSRVAKGRSLTESAIMELGAHCYDGQARWKEAGLADSVGTPELAIAAIAKSAVGKTTFPLAAAGGNKGGNMKDDLNPEASTAPVDPKVPAPAAGTQSQPKADAKLLANLCTAAGREDLLTGFINQDLTLEAATAELIKLRASGQHKPGQAGANFEINGSMQPLSGVADKEYKSGSLAARMRSKLKASGIRPVSERSATGEVRG